MPLHQRVIGIYIFQKPNAMFVCLVYFVVSLIGCVFVVMLNSITFISGIQQLQPYFFFWLGAGVKKGFLSVA
ncbi:Uncharacterized protein TCM_040710 [Theobroma cacao]|uniref:Uncharacterized protein n=1 Tax=Theobroma cacao TaxID=3641 RepID=A0A061GU69_THECC|nr:Uncharacterized protein TCM_040710 [Theobroma cacao]